MKNPGILLDANTFINIMQNLSCHIPVVLDAIKMVYSDEENVESK